MTRFSGHDLVCIRGERIVFRGLDFAVEDGGALVLTGPNGSGKSSLLRLMAGLLRPADGTLGWDGRPVWDEPDAHKSALHYVGHADPVKPVLSVAENLGFWAALRLEPAAVAGAVAAALDAFDIAALADVPGRFLSAGQKRRLNLARLAAAPARLWLLDEPATALDANAVGRLEAAIEGHRASGGMVVVSTHAGLSLADAQTLDLADYAVGRGAP